MNRLQIVLVDVGGNLTPKPATRHLIEAEVDAAVHARVIDVVGYFLQLGVVQRRGPITGIVADRAMSCPAAP